MLRAMLPDHCAPTVILRGSRGFEAAKGGFGDADDFEAVVFDCFDLLVEAGTSGSDRAPRLLGSRASPGLDFCKSVEACMIVGLFADTAVPRRHDRGIAQRRARSPAARPLICAV